MGFPLGYSELLLPRLLLQMVLLLSSIRRLISYAFTLLGLDDLLLDSDSDSASPWPDNVGSSVPSMVQAGQSQLTSPSSSISAALIQETLPVVRFQDLPTPSIADGCAVCLGELGPDDEVRLLGNCRHVFHRCCLDRWTEHEQSTCPLCRMPLVPEGMRDEFHDRMWAAANGTGVATGAAEFDGYSSFLISAY